MCDYGIQVEEEPFRERIINDHVGNILDEIICILEEHLKSGKSQHNSSPAFSFFFEGRIGFSTMRVWLSDRAIISSSNEPAHPESWFDKRSLEAPIFYQVDQAIPGDETLGYLLNVMKGKDGELRFRFSLSLRGCPSRRVHIDRIDGSWSMIHDLDENREGYRQSEHFSIDDV